MDKNTRTPLSQTGISSWSSCPGWLFVRRADGDASSASIFFSIFFSNRLKPFLSETFDNFKQRSKIQWLRLGDSNTRFLSIATRMKSSRNSTLKILNSEGVQTLSRVQLETRSMDYFRNLFKHTASPLTTIPMVFPKVVSSPMNEWLTQQPLK